MRIDLVIYTLIEVEEARLEVLHGLEFLEITKMESMKPPQRLAQVLVVETTPYIWGLSMIFGVTE